MINGKRNQVKNRRVYRKSGEITVFLSLLCLSICAFIGALYKSSKRFLVQQEIECCVDMALRSSMSEYDKKLLEDYELLYVDTTYKGVCEGGDNSFSRHVSQYIEENLSGSMTGLTLASVDVVEAEYFSEEDYIELFERLYEERLDIITNIYEEELNDTSLEAEDKEYFLERLIEIKEEQARIEIENELSDIDFYNLLESAEITAFIEDTSGKIYECTRRMSLSK